MCHSDTWDSLFLFIIKLNDKKKHLPYFKNYTYMYYT